MWTNANSTTAVALRTPFVLTPREATTASVNVDMWETASPASRYPDTVSTKSKLVSFILTGFQGQAYVTKISIFRYNNAFDNADVVYNLAELWYRERRKYAFIVVGVVVVVFISNSCCSCCCFVVVVQY